MADKRDDVPSDDHGDEYFDNLKAKALHQKFQHPPPPPSLLLRLHHVEATKKLALLALSFKRPSKLNKKRIQPAPKKGVEYVKVIMQPLANTGLVKVSLRLNQSVSMAVEEKVRKNAPIIRSLRSKILKHIPENARKNPSQAAIAAALTSIKSSNATTPSAESLYRMSLILACKRPSNQPINHHQFCSSILRASNQAIISIHATARKAYRDAQIKAQRTRLAALKSDNIEEYMQLVQSAKSDKITRLLSQTDACLRELSRRLSLQFPSTAQPSKTSNQDQKQLASSTAASSQSPIAALQQSSETWNNLSAAFVSSPLPPQPSQLIAGTLREYQLRGLSWMLCLRNFKLNGILADEMGLGKTVQVIALVVHVLEESKNSVDADFRPFLIAAPASVLPNWEREFATWAPDIHIISYKGNAEAREVIFFKQIRFQKSSLKARHGSKTPFHVVLTTYEYLMGKNDRPRLSSIPWLYVIVDEGHRLKNASCKLNTELSYYSASHRLLLTGTPLQNSLSELWSLLNFLMPDLFNSSDDFQTWFGGRQSRDASNAAKSKETNSSEGTCSNANDDDDDNEQLASLLSEEETLIVTTRLHQVLRPFMLRRLKDAVASDLPTKTEHLVYCQPSPYQKALFSAIETRLSTAGGIRGVNNALMELRVVCNHPVLSRLHAEGMEDSLMPDHPLIPEIRLCGKLEVLDRLLPKLKASNHRVLLFCTMTRALDVLETYLDWRGLSYLRLDGGTSAEERGNLVKQFNAPGSQTFVFLLSVRAGGVGLNLQAADTVVFYDTDWNPQMDAQAAARAHRIGQTRDVLVVRLITQSSIEEKIVAVAAEKLDIAERTITGGLFDGKTSSAERQKYLLNLLRQQDAALAVAGSGDPEENGGVLSDEKINQVLARNEEEKKLFAEEDVRRKNAEIQAFNRILLRKSKHRPDHDDDDDVLNKEQSMVASYSRIATPQEVQLLVSASMELLLPVDRDADKEFGRGKRVRHSVDYYRA